jgi:hypothetical protein
MDYDLIPTGIDPNTYEVLYDTQRKLMQVRITNVEIEWAKGRTGKYGKATVSYDFNGQARQQKIMSFANPEVFKKVQEMVGQNVEVEVAKNDSGFSEWKSISAGTASTPASSGAAPATRVSGSNYETKEERAARQVLIVKQSSLSAAVASLTPGAKAALDSASVIKLAQEYTDWVFDNQDDEEEPGDIPF